MFNHTLLTCQTNNTKRAVTFHIEYFTKLRTQLSRPALYLNGRFRFGIAMPRTGKNVDLRRPAIFSRLTQYSINSLRFES